MTEFETALTRMSEMLMAGDFRTILSYFELPLAIYAGDMRIICPDSERLLDLMGEYQLMLTQAGVRSFDTHTVTTPFARGGTGTIRVEKTYRDEGGAAIETCSLRYFVRATDDRPLICMVEYVRVPSIIDFPRLEERFRAAGALAKAYAGSAREVGHELPRHAS